MRERVIGRALERLIEIPHLACGNYPTPLLEMTRLRAHLGGGPRLFIKHDDQTGPGFGGNKVRKLEYLLAQALIDNVEVVITTGGEQSNHARITAMLAARLGLRAVLVLNRANLAPAVAGKFEHRRPASASLGELYGAEIHHVATREDRVPTMQAIANELRFAGKCVLEVPLGASVPLGALGYVRGVQELANQLRSFDVIPTHIFHASSSGGTQAGIVVGTKLAGMNVKVLGVSPDEPASLIEAEVVRIAEGVKVLLELEEGFENSAFEVLDQFIGPGYGVPSDESRAAIALVAKAEGVLLDPTYTSKAMAGLLAWIRDGRLTERDTVLFWHTGGQVALFNLADNIIS